MGTNGCDHHIKSYHIIPKVLTSQPRPNVASAFLASLRERWCPNQRRIIVFFTSASCSRRKPKENQTNSSVPLTPQIHLLVPRATSLNYGRRQLNHEYELEFHSHDQASVALKEDGVWRGGGTKIG